jgi:thioredoxin 1
MKNAETNSSAQRPLEVNDESFRRQVLEATQAVLVDFWAAWCGPCRMIAPVVEELAGDYEGRAKVVKLDVDANPETTARYNITSIPTLLVFKNGQVVEKLVGVVAKKLLAAKLDANLN